MIARRVKFAMAQGLLSIANIIIACIPKKPRPVLPRREELDSSVKKVAFCRKCLTIAVKNMKAEETPHEKKRCRKSLLARQVKTPNGLLLVLMLVVKVLNGKTHTTFRYKADRA